MSVVDEATKYGWTTSQIFFSSNIRLEQKPQFTISSIYFHFQKKIKMIHITWLLLNTHIHDHVCLQITLWKMVRNNKII